MTIPWPVLSIVAVAALTSLWLMVQVLRSDRPTLDKLGGIFLLAVPMLGPVLYWVVYNDLAPQDRCLQHRGGYGQFADSWRSMGPLYERMLKARREKMDGEEDQNAP